MNISEKRGRVKAELEFRSKVMGVIKAKNVSGIYIKRQGKDNFKYTTNISKQIYTD